MGFMETTSVFLPDDLLEEVLVRLPVKYLLRFKCVCKHWYALIGDYDFVKKHYHFQYAMHRVDKDAGPLFLDFPGPLFLDSSSEDEKPAQFYLLSKDGGDDVVLEITCDFQHDMPSAFGNDPELPNQSLQCIGVANGVIGLQWGRTRVALWNPATREFKQVARWPIIPDNEAAEKFGGEIHGFVFDQQSNDFKILGLIVFGVSGKDDESFIYEFHLYSLKSNSWKRIEKGPSGRPSLCFSDRDACLDNGIYYWLTYGDNWCERTRILSFDFKSENFKLFDFPTDYVRRNNQHKFDERECEYKFNTRIGKYKERLALFVTHTFDDADHSFEIWAVTKFREDDDGVPLSWEVVIIVEPIHSYNWALYVQAFRAWGDLLVVVQRGNTLEDEEACLYDPSTHTYKNLGLDFCSCYKFEESLFSLSG